MGGRREVPYAVYGRWAGTEARPTSPKPSQADLKIGCDDHCLKFQLNYERTNVNAPITYRTGPCDHEDLILTRFPLAY